MNYGNGCQCGVDIELIITLTVLQNLIVPLNNMQTLKFKAQPTNLFFATVNQMYRRVLPASDFCRAHGNQIKSLITVQTT